MLDRFLHACHAKIPLDGTEHCGLCFCMNVPLSAELHHEGEWWVGFCPEVPEANGQGRTREECLESLREAILLLMEDRREDARERAGELLELA